MISTTDFKKGVFIEVDNVPYKIVDFQHVKPGKGNAFVRTRLKNMLTGSVLDKTFKSGDQAGIPDIEQKQMQFLYADVNGFNFMDLESYDQTSISPDVVSDTKNFLTDNLNVDVLFFRGKPVAIEVPNFVNLKVTYTEPGFKGDTASGGGKPATLQTGLVVSVPYHIKVDEILKIDTRTSVYVEKVKS